MSMFRPSAPLTSACRRRPKAVPKSRPASPPRGKLESKRLKEAYNGSGDAPRTNAEADGDLLERIAAPDQPGRTLLTEAAERMRLSARGYHRVLRVARTLADLEHSTGVRRHHIAEALSYRRVSPSR